MRLARIALACACAALMPLAAAAPAGAAPKRLTTKLGNVADTGNNPIAFTGDRVVFLNRQQFQNFGSIESVTLSGKRRRLVTIKPTGSERNVSIRFDAAPGRLAYGMHEFEDPPGGAGGITIFSEIRTGPLDGPYDKVDGCDTDQITSPRDVRASTNAIVHMGNGCTQNALVLRGFSGGGYVRQVADNNPVSMALTTAIAGNFLALGPVFDHVANTQVYEPARRGITPKIQDDGTLIQVDYGPLQPTKGCGRTIYVFTAAQPGGRELPQKVCGADVAIAGNRIAAQRATSNGVEIVSMDLNGGDVRVLGRAPSPNTVRSLDTDGQRVVWHVLGCYVDSLWSATLGDKPVPAGPASCPAKLRSKTIQVKKGVAQIPMRCTNGCSQVLGQLRFSSSSRAFNSPRVALKPGDTILKVKLTKAQQKLVRDGKANKVPLAIDWIDVKGTNPSTKATVKLVPG
jgi:hypothetical protein